NNTNTNNDNSFWTKFAKIGKNDSFNNKKIFKSLYHVMVQIADREQHKKGLQNLKYSDQFSDFLVILASLSLRMYNIFRQNLAEPRVKRLVDMIEYTGPIIAMSDNIKIKEGLGFSSLFDIIKSCNAIASQVRVYLLQ
ncbi:13243_t:CDS:2, partial [Cetraspora pellucida]